MSGILCCSMAIKAADEVPCLIFSGGSPTEHCIDLEKLNRITFGNDRMIISSSKDNSAENVELLYSLFHHLEVGDAIPTLSALDETTISAVSDIRFNPDTKSLIIESDSELPFTTGIFTVSGNLMINSIVNAGESISVQILTPGVYIAVATDGEIKLTLKFIIN